MRPEAGAIIPGAGEGRRLGAGDKAFVLLGGRPMLAYAVEVLEASPSIGEIVVVIPERRRQEGERLAREHGWKKVRLSPGGPSRQASVLNGLSSLGGWEWVLVHDAARPFLSLELVERGLEAARETGAACAAIPSSDTIKRVDTLGRVLGTPPREGLWLVQTPQIFRTSLLRQAYAQARDEATDDAALVESLGHPVKVFLGSPYNFKITTREDLALAEAFVSLRARRGAPF